MNNMPSKKKDHRSREELLAENDALRLRLEEAEETMRAINSGEVDAVVVSSPKGNKIYSLEGAEKRYRILVETMNEGAATLAPDGTILYCNSFLASILKIPLEKLIGSQLIAHVAPVDFQAYSSLIEKNPEGTSRGEIRLVTGDGHDLPILLSRSSISQTGFHGFTMVLADLSEQKHSQQTIDALRFSEARYRALFLDNPTMIAMLDAECTILSVNPSCTNQLGYTKEELEGQSGLNLFPEDDRAAVAVELRRCLANPNQVHHWQFRKVRKNGELLWVEETVQAVPNLNGALDILLVCQDVTERKRAEGERERLLAQLEAVLNSITEGVAICDLQGNVLTMNPSALAVHEYESVDQVRQQVHRSQEVFELFDLNGRPIPYDQWPLSRVQRGERFTDYEVRVRRKDTGKSWIARFCGAPVQNKSGDTILSVVTFRDVTERKLVEMELLASEARFHAIFDLAAVGIAQISLDGHWLLMNQKLSDIIGYSFDELENMTLLQISHPDDIEPHMEHLRRLLAGEVTAYTMEKRYICKGGSILWVNLNVTLVLDRYGAPEYFIAIVEDINERKKAQEALRESEERFRLLAETAPVMIWESGPDARCTFFNRPWLEFTGRTLEQELGEGWTQGVHPVDRERCLDIYLSAFRDRRSFSMEYRLRSGEGVYAWIVDTGVPRLAPNGDLLGYIGTCFDITERKRAKEALQQDKDLLEQRVAERTAELDATIDRLHDEINERISMALVLKDETSERVNAQAGLQKNELLLLNQGRLAAMGEMVGNIAHQWRQPLNLLGLYAQDILMTYKKGDFNPEYLEAIVQKEMETIGHMSKTIDDFRSFFSPDKEKVDFKVLEVVEKTISLLENSFKAEQISTAVIPVGDPVVNGYPNELCQVLLNIMNNARDAFSTKQMPSPAITINIGTEEGRCVVTITDNAGGIPEDVIDYIFDPYFTTKGPDKGTGIGLFMSKMIIEKNMGGRLSVCNTGRGAEFKIEV